MPKIRQTGLANPEPLLEVLAVASVEGGSFLEVGTVYLNLEECLGSDARHSDP
jgi:hypothetical protein